MTMDATALDALAARAAAAAREVQEARWAVARSMTVLDDAIEQATLRGQRDWLGPARDAFDLRCERMRLRAAGEQHALRMLDRQLEAAAP